MSQPWGFMWNIQTTLCELKSEGWERKKTNKQHNKHTAENKPRFGTVLTRTRNAILKKIWNVSPTELSSPTAVGLGELRVKGLLL